MLMIVLMLAVSTADASIEFRGQIPDVARQLIARYREAEPDRYLDNLFRFQIAAGRYADARQSLAALQALRKSSVSTLPYEVYAAAKARQVREVAPFPEAFAQEFRNIVGALDDRTAAYEARWAFGTPLPVLEKDLRIALEEQRGKTSLAMSDAVALVRKFLGAQVYRELAPLIDLLMEEDDGRRYTVERDILVTTPDGGHVCALVVRPRAGASRLPALLNFTIYSGDRLPLSEARRSASHGYAGVEGFTRGKACSPDQPWPAERDGADAAAVVDWISAQPWSDGRVGMYGGSYEGFTQWAAAKHMPKALKALMPSVTFAPGIDFPMDGNIFMNYAYPWPFYTTNEKGLDDATYSDAPRWDRLNRDWYVSGRPYRELERIDGVPNPIFKRWTEHPLYDAYWRAMIPYRGDFARIDIPVLTTTGYYDGGQIGALYYFREHHRYNPKAEHYLVIGPYDHIGGQRGTVSPLGRAQNVLRNYTLDAVAHIDIGTLRYQWFDYVFRGGSRPPLLEDKVNYQVMGANVWNHAPSLSAMHDGTLRFHLTGAREGPRYRLSPRKPASPAFVGQTVDLADRSDADRMSRGEIFDQAQDDWPVTGIAPGIGNAIEFVSDPFPAPIEVSGLFAGRLDVTANKKDFDFSVTLFELTPAGQYMQLSYYWSRASHVGDRSHRRLLTPGKRVVLPFESGRLTSRRFEADSRLVVVIGVIKQPTEQINYGTGKDVGDESVADAGDPLQIRWYSSSVIDVPVRR